MERGRDRDETGRRRPTRGSTVPVAAALSGGAILVAAGLSRSDPTALAFVLGTLDPLVVTALACVLGLASLRVALALGWIREETGSVGGGLAVVGLGALLTVPVLVVDLLGGFPADINLPPPEAYFAYPAIALVAQFVFHAIPIGAVALAARGLGARRRLKGAGTLRRVALGLATLPEPLLQVAWGAGRSPMWANGVVGPHLLLFNAVEVFLLTRRGFLSAFLLRLGYYGVWHLAWGQLRLELLFGG